MRLDYYCVKCYYSSKTVKAIIARKLHRSCKNSLGGYNALSGRLLVYIQSPQCSIIDRYSAAVVNDSRFRSKRTEGDDATYIDKLT